jgi:plasmid stability protein
MPTLYVENVPDDLYDALRKRAKENRRSIASEVLSMLEENIPTTAQIDSRKRFLKYVKSLRNRKWPRGSFPSAEEMIRQDRNR